MIIAFPLPFYSSENYGIRYILRFHLFYSFVHPDILNPSVSLRIWRISESTGEIASVLSKAYEILKIEDSKWRQNDTIDENCETLESKG